MSKEIRLKIDLEDNASDALKNIQKAYDAINKSAEGAKKATQGIGNQPSSTSTGPSQNLNPLGKYYKQQQRKDKEEMIALAMAGDTASEAFQRLQQKTGDVKDNMDEVNNRVKYFASDTRGMDAAVEGIQAIGSVAQIAVGSMELLGISNDTATATVAKLASIEAILTGTKQLQAMVQRDSMIMLGLQEARTKTLTVATTLYNAAVGSATNGMKTFRLALAGTGIGAAVILIGALTAGLVSAYNATKNLEQAEKERQDKLDENAKKNADNIRTQQDKQKQLKVDYLRATGKDKEADNLEAKYALEEINKLEKEKEIKQRAADRASLDIVNKQIALKKLQEDQNSKNGKVRIGAVGVSTDLTQSTEAQIQNTKTELTNLYKAQAQAKYALESTSNTLETAYLSAGLKQAQNKNKASVSKQKQETVSATAPKTFNVYIQSLGEIQNVNIMNKEDELAFQQTLINVLTSSITSIQARASK